MSIPPTPPHLLVVDDDQGLLRLMEKTLRREGWSTAAASSGREAFVALAARTPDLLLLDLKLPDIPGQEMIHQLATGGRVIPFVIITGQGDERVAVEMMKQGALDYLVKDAHFIDFLPAVVRRTLDQLERDRQLAAAQTALAESRAQVLSISEREQRRFGAELHDNLGQQLTAIELRCQALKQDLRSERSKLEPEVSQICRYLREAIAQTRSMARGLSPVHLDSDGLATALAELALRMNESGRVHCVFSAPTPVQVEDEQVAGHLFRIAQEAVNNAVKHARASEVNIRLSRNDHTLRLEISDNGRGLSKAAKPTQGMGLRVMKDRASVIGGTLEITSKNNEGVKVICTVRAEVAGMASRA